MPVYLDHNATTRIEPRVLEAMLPYLSGPYANPSSQHRFGRAARDAIETARGQVAQLAGADPGQVIFTSGGTEANNLAVKGIATRHPGARLLYSAIEHPSVLEPMQALGNQGWRVAAIPVDAQGRVQAAALEAQLAEGGVALVSVMVANNETGVIQDIAALAGRTAGAGAVLHVDAVQAAGRLPLDFAGSGAQLMSLSSHKIYGPKGAGALVVNRSLDLEPLLHGGGQERGLRGGTENVAAIVGFGRAAELAREELERRASHSRCLRDRLEAGLADVPGLQFFGREAVRLPNTVQFAVPLVHSATLLGLLDRKGFAVSSGSACASGTDEPSHVLRAMGVPDELALCAVRVSIGKDSTEAEVDGFLRVLHELIGTLGHSMPGVALA